MGAPIVNHYVGEGPFVVTRPADADKFGYLVLVASKGVWAVREDDWSEEEPPDLPPKNTVDDGTGALILDDKGEFGAKSWRFEAHQTVTLWGQRRRSAMTAIWVDR